MATVSTSTTRRRRRTRKRQTSTQTPEPQRSVWPRRLAILGVGFVLFMWVLPMVICQPALVNRVLPFALGEISIQATVGRSSVGWFSPVIVERIEARNNEGQLFFSLGQLRTTRPLWSLLWSPQRIGKLIASNPEIHVLIEGDETNLEKLFAAISSDETDDPGGSALPEVEIEIDQGTLHITDTSRNRQWEVTHVQASVNAVPTGIEYAIEGDVQADERDGVFSSTGRVLISAENNTVTGGAVELDSSGLPLALAGAIGRRFSHQSEVDGRLNAKVNYTWTADPAEPPTAELETDMVVEQLLVAGPPLSGDRLELSRIHVPCHLVRTGDRVQIGDLRVECSLAEASFHGGVTLTEDWQQALSNETFELRGHVDLAALAVALPSTIHLRDDARITAGNLDLELRRTQEEDQFVLAGHVAADQLAGELEGRPITWDEPLSANFLARETEQGLAVDRLECRSDFLQVEAGGSFEELQASGQFDLERLSEQLGRFIELEPLDMHGNGSFQVSVARQDDRFSADGDLAVTGLKIANGGPETWDDPELNVRFKVVGQSEQWQAKTIDVAQCFVTAGEDQLWARLRQPARLDRPTVVWPLAVTLRGDTRRWQARMRPWGGLPEGWRLAGHAELESSIDYEATEVVVRQLDARVDGLEFAGAGLVIDQTEAHLSASGTAKTDASQLSLEQLEVRMPELQLSGDQLQLARDEAGHWRAEGVAEFSGDLHRLHGWYATGEQPDATRYWGGLNGTVRLVHHESVTDATAEVAVEQFAVAWSPETMHREPRLDVIAHVRYDANADRLEIDRGDIRSRALGISTTGHLEQLSGSRELAIEGDMSYDLERMAGLIQMFAGSGVRFAGRGQRKFSIRGPLANAVDAGHAATSADESQSVLVRLEADGGVDWQRGNAYGFVVGPGELEGHLSNGTLRIDPLDLAVSHGRLRASPLIQLSPGPATLTMPAGRLVERVRITPEMCAAGLQYIAPVLAGVAEAEGQFSIDLSTCQVPISTPDQGDVAGTFTVHDVRVGAGPLIRELAILLEGTSSVRLTRQSQVAFRVVQGRVYHQGLELVFPDATIRTQGSVGLDRTLAIMVEMPVPRKWIGNNPLGTALRNRTIRLPVGGTLDQPQLDRREMNRLAAQFVQEAAGDVLQDQLKRGLNRLLGPPGG